MRGSLQKRYRGSWSIVLDLGYEPDPETGKLRRKQKWHTVRGTRKQAEDRLADLLKAAKDGTYVDATKITVGEWLTEWFTASKARFRPSTRARFEGIINKHWRTAPLAAIPLQKLRSTHVEQYYAEATVSQSTLKLHHSVLHQALRKAVKNRLIATNPAADLDHKPRRPREKASGEAQAHAWTAIEARAFLVAAKAAGPQPAAFYALALDSGARRAELGGLTWAHLDLDAGKMRIVQQLLTAGANPTFGPTKTGRPRTVSLAPETVELLRAHRRHQRELRMANRSTYHDLDLVFAKEWADVQRAGARLGHPLQPNTLGHREFRKAITAADVKRIKFHGLRHTCATLLLQAGTPIHVVAERLGHATVSMTMEVYAHVLPDMQRDAASTLGALLHPR